MAGSTADQVSFAWSDPTESTVKSVGVGGTTALHPAGSPPPDGGGPPTPGGPPADGVGVGVGAEGVVGVGVGSPVGGGVGVGVWHEGGQGGGKGGSGGNGGSGGSPKKAPATGMDFPKISLSFK